MKGIYITAIAASLALAVLAAPFLAAPLSGLLRGSAPDLAALSNIDIATVPEWWLSGGFAACPDGLLATWALCLVASLLMALSGASGQRAADGGVLGSARIKTGAEAVRGSTTWDGKRSPEARGFVYGFSHGKYLFEPERFVLLDGSTGSGKSRFCLIPSIDLLTFGDGGNGSEPHSILVSDVKSEMIELTGEELERRGYCVLLLDTQHPMRGHRYNPLGLLVDYVSAGHVEEAEQAADTIATVIIPDERGGNAAHWTESGRSLLSAVVLFVALSDDCPEDAKHLATVYEVICRGTEGEGREPAEPLKALFRSLPPRHPARSRASQFLSSGGNELRSIVSTVKAQTRIFGSSSMAWMTSASDIDPRRVLTEKTALFLHVMDEGSPYNKICAILLDQIWSAVQLTADSGGGALSRPFSIVGDEWGNIPVVPSLPSVLSLGRSYGLFWLGAVQNMAQLNKYGERDGRKKILANCNVKAALKLGEAEDRQYFTELVGKTTRHTQGTSTNKGTTGSGGSTSYSEHADDVIHLWEWTERSPDRDGAIVVKLAMNGVPASHAGTFRTPLVDCTKTPTKEHFDLGTREHERERRSAYQRKLDARADSHRGEAAPIWCPEWPEDNGDSNASDGWDGLVMD